MSFLSKLFGSKSQVVPFEPAFNFLQVDMHSHLIPGIDDGVDTVEHSVLVIKELMAQGYKKIITTPHIMFDSFRNSRETILPGLDLVREALRKENIDIEIEAAAEYYLDEQFLDLIKSNNLMSFGKNYVLIETNYMHASPLLNKAIFDLKMAGYRPILAHPERYVYLYDHFEKFEEIYERGVLFQVNLFSLAAYYSPKSREMSEMMIEKNMVDFIGTDIHGERHFKALKEGLNNVLFSTANQERIKNKSLL
jgi:tyrosine-protein phosphatase YwqE